MSYLFFAKEFSCVPVYELMETRKEWDGTVIHRPALMNALWEYAPKYSILFQQQEVCPHIREHADQLTGSRLGEDLQISGLQDLARPGIERMALPSVQAPCIFWGIFPEGIHQRGTVDDGSVFLTDFPSLSCFLSERGDAYDRRTGGISGGTLRRSDPADRQDLAGRYGRRQGHLPDGPHQAAGEPFSLPRFRWVLTSAGDRPSRAAISFTS